MHVFPRGVRPVVAAPRRGARGGAAAVGATSRPAALRGAAGPPRGAERLPHPARHRHRRPGGLRRPRRRAPARRPGHRQPRRRQRGRRRLRRAHPLRGRPAPHPPVADRRRQRAARRRARRPRRAHRRDRRRVAARGHRDARAPARPLHHRRHHSPGALAVSTSPARAAAPAAGALSHRQILAVFGGLMTAMLLAALDQTIVATALPTIVGELGGLDHLSWVVTAYLLTSTVSVPLYGKISDLYGRKLLYQAAIVIFL